MMTAVPRGGSVVFQIPTATDVPSDHSPHKATIGVFRLRPKFDYVCVPKLAEAVFRRAKMSNASSYTMLPGRAQIFIDDDFQGASDLPLTAPGQRSQRRPSASHQSRTNSTTPSSAAS